jgi:aspartyl-tRNA(Asn)/glutamyl-tRNA(Gln) amidotransferase subunit B
MFKLNNQDHVRLELAVYDLIQSNKLSSTSAKNLFSKLAGQAGLPEDIEQYAEKEGYIQVSDEGKIETIVEQVISDNPQAAEDVRSGETKAIGFLVGQVMKASKGKANPRLAQDLIRQKLK